MKIVIAGGTGFIGEVLTRYLLDKGHQIVILTRKSKEAQGNISYVKWLVTEAYPELELEGADVFINLAGVSINAGRWTMQHQHQIYESRMKATDELLRIISTLLVKPSVFINASAIGIYPASDKKEYTETTHEVADDFLGKTVKDWEEKAGKVAADGIRCVFMRFGVILGREGGALPLMVLPYKFFVGGRVGTGKQWVSWVHLLDVVKAIYFVVESKRIIGPVNITAPAPVTMDEFGRTIGDVTHRPHWLPVPNFALKFVLGKKSALVLKGQKVIPEVLINSGFTFTFPTLTSALEDLLK